MLVNPIFGTKTCLCLYLRSLEFNFNYKDFEIRDKWYLFRLKPYVWYFGNIFILRDSILRKEFKNKNDVVYILKINFIIAVKSCL